MKIRPPSPCRITREDREEENSVESVFSRLPFVFVQNNSEGQFDILCEKDGAEWESDQCTMKGARQDRLRQGLLS